MNTNEKQKITILKIVNFALLALLFIYIQRSYGIKNYISNAFIFYDDFDYLYVMIVPVVILMLNIVFFFKQKNQLKKQKCLFWLSVSFYPFKFIYFLIVLLFFDV